MIINRGKNCKSETPTRQTLPTNKITHLVGIGKKSDPFLKQLREVYDKQNINPNLKENRIKSYNSKADHHLENRNSVKKVMHIKSNKYSGNANQSSNSNNQRVSRESQLVGSNSKYHSTELQRMANQMKSNRKSTEKDEIKINRFQEEYYSKDQKKDKKMKVTLKDAKLQRKSIQDSQEYIGRLNGQIKYSQSNQITQSIINQSIGTMSSMRNQYSKNQNFMIESTNIKTQGSTERQPNNEYKCLNHPQKKASHRLIDRKSQQHLDYCEKCAVGLATKGYHVIALNLPQKSQKTKQQLKRQQRTQKLKDFVFQLDKIQPIFQHSSNEMEILRSLVENKYHEEENRLITYYNRIKQEVEISYEKSIFNLRIHFESVFQEIDKNDELIGTKCKQVKTIKEDIVPNIDSIVQEDNVKEDAFRQIILCYNQNFRSIEKTIKQLSEHNYQYYEFNYDKNHHFFVNIQDEITPTITMQPFGPLIETQRNNNSKDKRFDSFRMSFGKDSNPNCR